MDKIRVWEQNKECLSNRIKRVTPAHAGVSYNQEIGDSDMRRNDSPKQRHKILIKFYTRN